MSASAPDPDAERLEALQHHLVRIERLLEVGFSEQIKARRAAVELDDGATAAILARTATWTAAGSLKRDVEKATGQSDMTVKRRFKRLLEVGALESRGKSVSAEYRNTGLLG
jgi:hypothetical protein